MTPERTFPVAAGDDLAANDEATRSAGNGRRRPSAPASAIIGDAPPPTLRDRHKAYTRQALIDAARELFASQGYEATSTEDILRAAGASRGALYHHFANKQELFRSVLEAVEADFIDQLVTAGAAGGDIWDEIANGCQSFLDVSTDAPIRRIVLIDGPSVLGWEEWMEVEMRYGLGLLRGVLQEAVDQGVIARQPVEPLADLLTGALNQAAMAIAHAEDPAATRKQLGDALNWLFTSLRGRNG